MLWKNPVWPWVLLFVALGLFSAEYGGTNAISRVAALRSVTEAGRLDIDLYKEWSADWALSPNGHYYSNKAPGGALLGLPVFAALDFPVRALGQRDENGRALPPALWELWLFSFLMQMLPFSLLVLRLARELRDSGAPAAAVHFFGIAALLGNTAALYMDTYFGHGLASLLFLASFALWQRRSYGPSGLLLGACVLTDYGAACLLPVFVACTLYRERSARPLLPAALGLLPGAALWAWYHQAAFGSPFVLATFFSNPAMLPAADAGGTRQLHSLLPSWRGLTGLLVGQERGILFTQPWVLGLFALPFAGKTVRLPKGAAAMLAGGLALLVWATAGTPSWHGGSSLGPRYLSFLFPAAAYLFALAWKDLAPRARIALALALAVSVALRLLVFPFTVVPPLANLWGVHFGLLVALPWYSDEFLLYLGGLVAFLATASWAARREKAAWRLPALAHDRRFALALAAALSLLVYAPLLGKGTPPFHVAQLALWIVFVALAATLLRTAGPALVPLSAWTALLCLHPVHATSVASVSSLRQLLAACFCLAATLLLVRGQAARGWGRVLALVLYALSVLSHPIFLAWPLWVALRAWIEERKPPLRALKSHTPLLGTMAALGALNGWLYLKEFPLEGAGAEHSGPGLAVLAIGRAFYNLVLPLQVSPLDYFPGAPENLAGILLLVLFAAAVWKLLPVRTSLVWGAFAAFPLVFLYPHGTRVSHPDTYLLFPALGVWILAAALAERGAEKWRRLSKLALAGIFVLLVASALPASRGLAMSFLSEERLYGLAYAKEATPQVRIIHGRHLLGKGSFREAALLAMEEKERQPEAAAMLFAEALAADPTLPADRKISALRAWQNDAAPFRYYVARVLAENGQCEAAREELRAHLAEPARFGKVENEALALARDCGRGR